MKTRLRRLAVAAVALSSHLTANSSVYITEIMPCNIATYRNAEKEYSGWVEFYNDGKDDVNLKGWNITNYQKKSKKGTTTEPLKWSWDIDYTINVPAGEYVVVQFDNIDEDEYEKIEDKHAPYKVDPDGGILELTSPKGAVSDFNYPQMKTHISYGTFGEDDANQGYMEPTPGEKNKDGFESLESQCAKPKFSDLQPGVKYPDEWSSKKVKLSCETEKAVIYYTTNGSIPTKSSKKYVKDSTKIEFDTTCNVRARAFKDGYLPSEILTGTFVVYKDRGDCEGKDAPVVSIVTDKKFFYDDEIGIYHKGNGGKPGNKGCISERANYNQPWKRAVNFEYFVDGKQVLSQEAMVSIMGGCSRQWPVKSLKITTNKITGAEVFDYHFFKDKKENLYSSLQLRNGGNGFETIRCRDGFIQSLAKGFGNLDYQAYQPVGFYINGWYRGLMGLRERTNDSYIEANYGISKDKVDVVEMTENKIEASAGDLNAYNEMIEFATDSNNYKKDNFVAMLSNYMDVEEYANYMIFEQFIVNTDWPGNNQKCWRKHIGGKFRWILYDTDFGLGLYDNSGHPNYTGTWLNTITWCTGEGSDRNWANASAHDYQPTEESKWKVILFKSLMKNEGFRNMFLTQAYMQINSALTEEIIQAKADSIMDLVRKEHCATKKTTDKYASLTDKMKAMVSFATERISVYKKDLAEYCGLDKDKKAVLSISCKGDFKDKVQGYYVNDVATYKNTQKIKLLKNMNVKLRPILPNGYIVEKWQIDTTTFNTQSINFKLNKDTIKVVLTIQEESYDKPSIVINELCSKSSIFIDPESNEGEDWIELYNTGDDYVDVAGYYLQDKDTTVRIAQGYELTNIPPKGHLLLWADGRGKSGAQHLGFKLSSEGEDITLYKDVRDSIIVVDHVKMGAIGEDCSYGRVTDGAEEFTIFPVCSESKGFSEATPGEENGIYDCQTVIEMRTYPVEITCDFESAKYNVNGEVYSNPLSYRLIKGKKLTVSPVLPKKCEFVKWELSTFVESNIDILTDESEWMYHYADSAPSGNWKEVKYADTSWSPGYGLMGYNSSKEKAYDTKIPYEEGDSAKYITAYFRKVFNIDDTTGLKNITANITYDDGVAIYVNGKEINRFNLPDDSLHTELRYEDTTLHYYDDLKDEIVIQPSMLKSGENIIAAEVHQINSASSDLTFKLTAKAKFISHFCEDPTFSVTPKEAFTANLIVNDKTGIEDHPDVYEEVRSSITFYPNPTKNLVYLQGCEGETLVSVSDLTGSLLIMQYIFNDKEPIDLSKLSHGTYILHAVSNTQQAVGKIIKE